MHGMKFTSELKLKHEWAIGHHNLSFYNVSIPVFSSDGQFARVELEAISGFNMGGEYVFILRKIKGNWKIVKQYQTGIA